MLTEGREESTNIEDARGQGVGGLAVGGGIVGVLVMLLATLAGIDPKLLQSLGFSAGGNTPQKQAGPPDPKEEKKKAFVGVVLKDLETVWAAEFPKQINKQYKVTKLKLYTGAVQSACGFAKAAVGPFYCPGDERVYLDLSFFEELDKKLGAKGDFAMAYVIAHEVGHHIQTQVGYPGEPWSYSTRVNKARNEMSEKEYNKEQVRLELQADYLAGVWAHFADKRLKVLEPDDIREALGAAEAVGDDTLQKKYQGNVRPESFTHGSAKSRTGWFLKGFKSGDLKGMHELFERDFKTIEQP